MTTSIRDIAYAPEYGFRGEGDLYLPENAAGAPTVLVIHGGGWQAMDRFRFDAVCAMLAENGFAVFNVNYRLTGTAPWPACGDDCLRAARFLLDAGHPAMQPLGRERIAVLGASAGGHLALMTGLRLPADRVAGIVDIAGPSDLASLWEFHGPQKFGKLFGTPDVSREMLDAASPISYVTADAPPLLCVQSTNDRLVPPEQTERIAAQYERHGRPCAINWFAGEGEAHGIWRPPCPAIPDFLVPIEEEIKSFLAGCFA
jgi:acetyl esterase/lipase